MVAKSAGDLPNFADYNYDFSVLYATIFDYCNFDSMLQWRRVCQHFSNMFDTRVPNQPLTNFLQQGYSNHAMHIRTWGLQLLIHMTLLKKIYPDTHCDIARERYMIYMIIKGDHVAEAAFDILWAHDILVHTDKVISLGIKHNRIDLMKKYCNVLGPAMCQSIACQCMFEGRMDIFRHCVGRMDANSIISMVQYVYAVNDANNNRYVAWLRVVHSYMDPNMVRYYMPKNLK